ncbi:hypothetical protein [Sandaracinus amylolyticus]|uniref:hypothetical protein n=1 Tax=Sandaracinus amylolyticus TaxID=927083 RepID=UPI001F45B8A0|nr:hypothetical protein [Sandaracinus amylolyticus]UJR81497.1 Hypothetical protein I5071_35570 [Sandaracinus amylolyticus]
MPESTRVPSVRRTVPLGEAVQVGRSVAARQWSELAPLVNYLRGRGSVLIPGHAPMLIVDAAGSLGPTNRNLRYRTRPSGRAIARVWLFELVGNTGGDRATVSVGASTISVAVGPLTSSADRAFLLVETASKTTAISSMTVALAAVSGAVQIVGVTCWELPRAQLTKDATDLGIDLGTLDSGRPILDRDYESVAGVCEALASADGRRVGLVSWWGPQLQFASGTYESVFELPIRIVPPRVGMGDSIRSCQWTLYAWCDVGTTGDARIVTDTGAVSGLASITATTGTWLDPGARAFRCEQAGTVDGLPSGTWPTVQLEVRRASGAGNVYVQGFNLYDGLW